MQSKINFYNFLKKKAADSLYTPVRLIQNIIDQPAVILIYHRVVELKRDSQLLAVHPENFYRQVEHIRKNYRLLDIAEFISIMNNKETFPPGSVIITFDDGYADNLHNALPVLESLSAQAVFYYTTSMLESDREIWWDQLEKIFFDGSNYPPALKLLVNGTEYSFKTGTAEERIQAYLRLHPIIKFSRFSEKEIIISYLLAWAGLPSERRAAYRFMNTDELKKMSGSKSAVIGAHTHTHTPLSMLSYKEQFEEIKKSADLLEKLTGKKISHFSYPFGGRRDYNRDSVKACEEIGFDMVCSNFYWQVHRWTSRFELPRILVRNWDFDFFKIQLKKFFRY